MNLFHPQVFPQVYGVDRGCPWDAPQELGKGLFRCLPPYTRLVRRHRASSTCTPSTHHQPGLMWLECKTQTWARQTNSWPLGAHRPLQEARVEGKMTQEAQVMNHREKFPGAGRPVWPGRWGVVWLQAPGVTVSLQDANHRARCPHTPSLQPEGQAGGSTKSQARGGLPAYARPRPEWRVCHLRRLALGGKFTEADSQEQSQPPGVLPCSQRPSSIPSSKRELHQPVVPLKHGRGLVSCEL